MAVAIIALSMVFATLPLFAAHANPDTPKIYVSPANISNAVTNNDYTVYVKVANVTDLYAWEFQLNYSTSILSLTYASNVTAGLNTPQLIFKSLTDTTNGHLWWVVSTRYPGTGISYADQAIFEIHFHTIGTGTATLQLYGTVLVNSADTTIDHTTVSGSITVGTIDLTVTSITVLNYTCSIYANDTYIDGTTKYYVPVNVTIHNAGTMDAGSFNVSLAVYWLTGSLADGYGELRVASLAAGASLTLKFTAVFHPTHTHYYELTATVDNHNEVVESNEANNVLVYNPGPSGIKVTVMGDIDGSGTVGLQDAVTIAQAWEATATPLSPQWNIKADINHDGTVDLYDAARLELQYGKSW